MPAMSVEGIRDPAAYLRTLPAVQGWPPAHEISFPFTGDWRCLYFTSHLRMVRRSMVPTISFSVA